jgi:ABC-type uncharacterized transport system auxiliary subunit
VRRRLAHVCGAAGLALLAACLPRPEAPQPVVRYDFGPPGEPAGDAVTIPVPVVVRPPDAPVWMDSPAIHYRLAYGNPARIRSYALNRWVSSPVRLLSDVLQRRLGAASPVDPAPANGEDAAAATAEYVLETHLEEFAQVFDSESRSRGVVSVRAVLLRHGGRQLVARETFRVEVPAPTPDAPGGVEALAAASRTLADRVAAWIAASAASLETPTPPAPASPGAAAAPSGTSLSRPGGGAGGDGRLACSRHVACSGWPPELPIA